MQTPENTVFNFNSEASLENFVWQNLQKLLSLTPIARQHHIEEQVCDILATDLNKQLVVSGNSGMLLTQQVLFQLVVAKLA